MPRLRRSGLVAAWFTNHATPFRPKVYRSRPPCDAVDFHLPRGEPVVDTDPSVFLFHGQRLLDTSLLFALYAFLAVDFCLSSSILCILFIHVECARSLPCAFVSPVVPSSCSSPRTAASPASLRSTILAPPLTGLHCQLSIVNCPFYPLFPAHFQHTLTQEMQHLVQIL